MRPTVTLIINTAQQAEYLSRVLRAVTAQSKAPLEVALAEDGEDPETREVIARWAKDYSAAKVCHFTQEKAGFRRSRILNVAIAGTTGDYVVFLDGDTIPHPDFVRDHGALARRGHFVQGHRVLVKREGAEYFGRGRFNEDRRRALWAGHLMGLKHVYRWVAPFCRVLPHPFGVRGCNLGVWRDDLIRVNGYDEVYIGWGCEDLDLALRLIRSGIARLDVRGRGLCYHLWHPPADRTNLAHNQRRLDEVARSGAGACAIGLNRHLARASDSPASTVSGPEEQSEQEAGSPAV